MVYYTTLLKQHQDILGILSAMSGDLSKNNLASRAENLYQWVSKLSSILEEHLLLEDDFLYPVLRKHPDDSIRNIANAFFSEIGDLKSAFTDYAGKWASANDIANSAEAFASETKVIAGALRSRIRREEEELFPGIIQVSKGAADKKDGQTLLTVSKWLLMISGALLALDSILIIAGIPNPFFGWPLPCPVVLFLLGAGILLFGISSEAFKKE